MIRQTRVLACGCTVAREHHTRGAVKAARARGVTVRVATWAQLEEEHAGTCRKLRAIYAARERASARESRQREADIRRRIASGELCPLCQEPVTTSVACITGQHKCVWSRADAARELALPATSRTVRWLADGEISLREAHRIADVVSDRHDATDYDRLLRAGYDRDDAREIIREQLPPPKRG